MEGRRVYHALYVCNNNGRVTFWKLGQGTPETHCRATVPIANFRRYIRFSTYPGYYIDFETSCIGTETVMPC